MTVKLVKYESELKHAFYNDILKLADFLKKTLLTTIPESNKDVIHLMSAVLCKKIFY